MEIFLLTCLFLVPFAVFVTPGGVSRVRYITPLSWVCAAILVHIWPDNFYFLHDDGYNPAIEIWMPDHERFTTIYMASATVLVLLISELLKRCGRLGSEVAISYSILLFQLVPGLFLFEQIIIFHAGDMDWNKFTWVFDAVLAYTMINPRIILLPHAALLGSLIYNALRAK